MSGTIERANAQAFTGAYIARGALLGEHAHATGIFRFECHGPAVCDRREFAELRDRIVLLDRDPLRRFGREARAMRAALADIPLEAKWRDEHRNTVLTLGKNKLLDEGFAGSSYTAAWYVFLISSSGYSAISAADTAASHAGWTESTAYSESTRVAASWSAASSGSKALSAAASFSINGTDTIKGGGVWSNSTKGGTTGVIYSAGLFSGGDRAVVNTDTLNVSYAASL